MALYRTGTAAMDAQGVITGTGTKWREPLSLIRTGATIVFLTTPLKLAVISEIVSDTEMKAIQTDGDPVANGNYVILLNDSLTVDGMAQDVAETLRYYQSKETVIEEAIEFFKNFDLQSLVDLVNQIKDDAAKVAADRAATEKLKNETNQIKSDTNTIKNQTQQIKDSAVTEVTGIKNEALDARDEAESAQLAAEQSKIGADSAKAGAETARDEARQWAQQVNPENLLHKDQNLSDIQDKSKAKENLTVDRLLQDKDETVLYSPDKRKFYSIKNAGTGWGVYSLDAGWIPLGVVQGGTGAKTVNDAKANLQIDRFIQFDSNATHIYANTGKNLRFTLASFSETSGTWGVYNEKTSSWMPLGPAQGGTGGTLDSGGTQTILKSPNGDKYLYVNDSGNWGCYSNTPGVGAQPLPVGSGGTGATTVSDARNNLQLGAGAYVQFAYVTCEASSYPGITLRNNKRLGLSDAGARLQFEIPDSVGGRPYLNQVPLSGGTGGILNNLPSTSGVLAIQGTSGRDYKKDISLADSNEALSRVTSLEMVNFVYKDDEKQRVRFGVIAEDAEKIAPQYVKHNQFPIPGTEVFDDDGNKIGEEYQDRPSIDVNPIVMDLLGCIQSQQKQIDELKATISEMQAMLAQFAK